MAMLRDLVAQLAQPVEILNLVAGSCFFLRFVVQWLVSERRKESVIPEAFWWISIGATLIAITYGCLKPAPSVILQNLAADVVYARNLVLLRRMKRRLG